MLGLVITFLIVVSLVCGVFTGKIADVSSSSLSACGKAVELVIYLCGSMALWGGLIRICEKSGLTGKIARLLSPVTKLLFKDAAANKKAMSAITMNITANLLGLGNAATPTGIAAAKELDKLPHGRKRCISMLVVLNTASIQLIPSTIAAMRLEHGAAEPFDISPAIIFSSLISVTIGCAVVYALNLRKGDCREL